MTSLSTHDWNLTWVAARKGEQTRYRYLSGLRTETPASLPYEVRGFGGLARIRPSCRGSVGLRFTMGSSRVAENKPR
jgi:hypothetical protein